MKFHSISAVMTIMAINYSVGVAIWQGNRITGNTFNWVVKIIGMKPGVCKITRDIKYVLPCSHCTGSIISKWHILTAAHCFEVVTANEVSVAAGHICVNDRCESRRHRVKEIHIHPNYGFNIINIPEHGQRKVDFGLNDVAILTLSSQLSFGERIAAVPLPTREPDRSRKNLLCRVAGWTENPIEASVEHLEWTTIKIESSAHNGFMECEFDGFICGRNSKNASLLTGGDSGGGLLCEGVIAGIATVAPSEFNRAPMLFETAYHFLPFINRIFNKDANLLMSSMPKPRQRRECICL